jgi:site-specific DNA-methyltransferase (adenine-specific)
MKPYYEDEFVTLFHGDCLEVTDWVEADVLVTDPPYGMSFQSGQSKLRKLPKIAGDRDITVRDNALSLWPKGKPGIVFGTWRVQPPVMERQRLIWWKESTAGMGDLRMPFGNSHEEIHVIGSGWDRESTGLKRTGSVITTKGVRGGASGEENTLGHPTPKPVGLMERLISYCPPGVIADPFAGGGATIVAARNLGRKVIGVELEEKYCEVIAKRLSQQAFNFEELMQ